MAEYIEREALMKDLELLADYQRGERQQGILGACETIRRRKAADVVEVRHGEWFSNGGSFSTPRCSLCNWKKPYTEDYWCGDILYTHWNYCPKCGAKMD